MRWRVSNHAQEQVRRRRISMELLESVMEHPQQIVPQADGTEVFQSQLDFGDGTIFLLRAIVNIDVDPAIVVTIYRTSKIGKYWSSP